VKPKGDHPVAISYAVRPATLTIASPRGAASHKLSATLWALQSLLALIFLFSGAMKLLASAEMMEVQSPLPLPLLLVRFIGTCEVAGALGLLLPGLLRVRPNLTPLAAAGLVALMIGATILTPIMISRDPVMTVIPATIGAMAAFVAYGRLRLAPLRGRWGWELRSRPHSVTTYQRLYDQHGTQLVARHGNWRASAWDPDGHGEHAVEARCPSSSTTSRTARSRSVRSSAGGWLESVSSCPHIRPGITQSAFLH
jgi:uncharacterized membrane protein YphA (DoxX/SURF4 family)